MGRLLIWIWWAPFIAVVLHIAEEFIYPGGFADWDRSYRPSIRKSITPRLHIIINAALLLACVQIGLLARTRDSEVQTVGLAMWLTISALLFSNAVFHVIGTIRSKTRSPGVVTAVTLYLPLTILGYWYFVYNGKVSLVVAIAAVILGGSYHLWADLLHIIRAKNRVE
jgi:hypothetical protein